MAKILIVGLNPAWQKILQFNGWEKGRVNRALSLAETASGKGLNAAGVLRKFGHEVSLLQITGGAAGKRILQSCRSLGIRALNVSHSTGTRTCITLVDRLENVETEVIEPSGIARREVARMAGQVLKAAVRGGKKYNAVLFAGQPPEGLPENLYGRILAVLEPDLVAADAYQHISSDFFHRIDILKINLSEYRQLSTIFPGITRPGKGPDHIMLTNGPGPAYYLQLNSQNSWEREELRSWEYRIPEVRGMVNPIGAGDVVSAGLVHYCLKGLPFETAFAEALALGAASCTTLLPGDVNLNKARIIAKSIEMSIRKNFSRVFSR